MHLILLRHTRLSVDSSICYGCRDVDVADSFASECQAIQADLPPFDRVTCSPLRRCQLLARQLADASGLTLNTSPDLVEMNFGFWQGQSWDDIPRKELDQWAEDFEHARPHGGESVAMLRLRVRHFLEACQQPPTHRHLLVTHAGVIRAILALVTGADERHIAIDFGEYREVSYTIRQEVRHP